MARPPDTLIARYKALIARYGDRTASGLVRAWDQLGSYGDDDITRYTRQTAPLLAGAKTAAVAASSAFFTVALRTKPLAIAADAVDIEPRITHPFLALYHAVAEGRPNLEALAAGRAQAEAVALDFVTSTARRTGDIAAERSGQRVRWARVPAGDACAFCQTVSGQTYHSAESADFGHDRCNCAVVPA